MSFFNTLQSGVSQLFLGDGILGLAVLVILLLLTQILIPKGENLEPNSKGASGRTLWGTVFALGILLSCFHTLNLPCGGEEGLPTDGLGFLCPMAKDNQFFHSALFRFVI